MISLKRALCCQIPRVTGSNLTPCDYAVLRKSWPLVKSAHRRDLEPDLPLLLDQTTKLRVKPNSLLQMARWVFRLPDTDPT